MAAATKQASAVTDSGGLREPVAGAAGTRGASRPRVLRWQVLSGLGNRGEESASGATGPDTSYPTSGGRSTGGASRTRVIR